MAWFDSDSTEGFLSPSSLSLYFHFAMIMILSLQKNRQFIYTEPQTRHDTTEKWKKQLETAYYQLGKWEIWKCGDLDSQKKKLVLKMYAISTEKKPLIKIEHESRESSGTGILNVWEINFNRYFQAARNVGKPTSSSLSLDVFAFLIVGNFNASN